MKTRATLQTSPFKTRDGEWKATFTFEARGRTFRGEVIFGEEQPSDRTGDTITVERHGSEWRAA